MKPVVICLTPTKNEAWLLERFLDSASIWADHIIIADQISTDGSREIAQKFPKVILIDNNSDQFNEPERQKLLIARARKIEGQRLLIALDADEMFSPEIFTSNEWIKVLNAQPGTIINFQWANLCPDFKRMWYSDYFPLGYMDDGSEHGENEKIHTARIPIPKNHPVLHVLEIKVMHLQYTNWERMESKHRWYQCYERITYPTKSAVDIFRMYNHMYTSGKHLEPIPMTWFTEYSKLGIELPIFKKNNKIWFDKKVLDLFDEYGISAFRKLRIWDTDWGKTAKEWNRIDSHRFKDPRTLSDKMIQWWLFITQPIYKNRSILGRLARKIDKMISQYLRY